MGARPSIPVMKVLLIVLVTLCLLSGCSQLNGTRFESVLGKDVNLVQLGDKVVDELVAQPVPPLIPFRGDQPILVTTPVNNDDLQQTSAFGRSFQNDLVAGFAQRGYAVKELKLRRDIMVKLHQGEFMLTRNLAEMAVVQRAQAVVVSTYTLVNRVLYLSVRLVSPDNQAIRGVYEEKIVLDEDTLRLLGFTGKKQQEDDESVIMPPKPSVLDSLLY